MAIKVCKSRRRGVNKGCGVRYIAKIAKNHQIKPPESVREMPTIKKAAFPRLGELRLCRCVLVHLPNCLNGREICPIRQA